MPGSKYGLTFRFIDIIIKHNKIQASTPLKYVWIIGLIFGIMSITGHFNTINIITNNNHKLLLSADSAFKES
jgi:hypothetical protein